MRKPTSQIYLLAPSLTLALAFLPLALFNHFAAATFCKVGSIVLLLALVLFSRPFFPMLAAALAFSALGDLFLELHQLGRFGPATLFLLGLASFLAAHLSYIALFAPRAALGGTPPLRRLGTFLIAIAVLVMLKVIFPYLGAMRLPVTAYAFVLGVMAITAQRSYFRGMAALGSVLFVASDSMLALAHFRGPFLLSGPLIWFSYYAAQVLIALGVLHTSHNRADY